MVYYFTSKAVDPAAFIYVGKDKFENEELIKYGWEEDGTQNLISQPSSLITDSHSTPLTNPQKFHVDKLSSAHIYLRLPDPKDPSTTTPMTWDAIPEPLLTDLAQLTKANSIEGNKKDNITIIYTPWSNLKKDGSMAVGQVSFKDPRKVKKVLVAQRENPIVNRLNKTKVEKKPDLQQERDDRLKVLRKRDQASTLERKREEARVMQERKEKKWQKDHAYDDIFTEENMEATSNQNRDENWEDDFM
ncbi:hypothetical protein HER10_EVM0003476 [Colletotrichum scovillei]|uniref:Coiled-coil domain-containing protein 25 n=1 Tax=Colletotrichum scovillei TaxID=1209932 RepID=A0A9P7UJZ4_9PEZI|nr:uncharacterized protein HER10_EVM0003476 [Colletotrichum scovillei]KAF4782836.1 hypothetical protein HER10_EVM0003476 [Colletotrichum scovillei]KAG7053095.1 coiled-coil domain-containing protein 25 [Colletotrichum scovillei]KAG7071390.1 coiled-coil domain-containing protein 25 [Colletotrichum scovillei]KAG7079608.1 coiled-coil domain-containing protein 25 [Colletotrichum scovillei]